MNDSFFRVLDADEQADFRAHARAHYRPGSDILEVWHPVYREECERMNAEHSTVCYRAKFCCLQAGHEGACEALVGRVR